MCTSPSGSYSLHRHISGHVAWTLIGLNNKNPKSDIGVNAERLEKQSSQPIVLTSTNSTDKMGNPVSRNSQTESTELLSPPILCSSLYLAISLPVSTFLILELKTCDSQVLGLKVWAITAWFYFSFGLDQSLISQDALELTEICLLLPSEFWD